MTEPVEELYDKIGEVRLNATTSQQEFGIPSQLLDFKVLYVVCDGADVQLTWAPSIVTTDTFLIPSRTIHKVTRKEAKIDRLLYKATGSAPLYLQFWR